MNIDINGLFTFLSDNGRTLIGLVAIGAGIGVLVRQWLIIRLVERSMEWPSTPGLIIKSGTEWESGNSYGRRCDWVKVSNIAYIYHVGGRELMSNVVCLGGQLDTSTGGPARERVERYPLNEAVDVFYNPENPEQACLEQTTEGTGFTVMIAGFFIVIGLLVMTGVVG